MTKSERDLQHSAITLPGLSNIHKNLRIITRPNKVTNTLRTFDTLLLNHSERSSHLGDMVLIYLNHILIGRQEEKPCKTSFKHRLNFSYPSCH